MALMQVAQHERTVHRLPRSCRISLRSNKQTWPKSTFLVLLNLTAVTGTAISRLSY